MLEMIPSTCITIPLSRSSTYFTQQYTIKRIASISQSCSHTSTSSIHSIINKKTLISEISDARQAAKYANRLFHVLANEGNQRCHAALLYDDFATGLQSGEAREKRDAELLDVERNALDADEFEDDGDDVEGVKQATNVD